MRSMPSRRPVAEATRILLDPGGRTFDQQLARELAARPWLVFVAPRYEGVDERVRPLFDLELSIGDYILSGGELPALVVIDAVLRLLPGAIDEASPIEESFSESLLEYPQYTRPAEFRGQDVPDVLVSGHHGEVAKWRRAKAIERTRAESARPARSVRGRCCPTGRRRSAERAGRLPAILPDRQPNP